MDIEQAHTGAFGTGLILEKAEQERAFSGSRGCFVPVQIPQQRLAGGVSSRVLLGAPNRPERRVVAFDGLAGGSERFEQGKDLQPAVPVEIAPVDVQRPAVNQ